MKGGGHVSHVSTHAMAIKYATQRARAKAGVAAMGRKRNED
jgi:hypothetical protein